MSEIKKSEKKICDHCGKPGGRLRNDPYREEIYGEKIEKRLHDNCYAEIAVEI